ncbi:MAG: ATP synthase F0 subunit B [Oscillospiraceae bacterium]|jgi:F-type H+-transporting ATPase subunit b|nr:ATP synthase F0 subunit B [Oscillospiraceae bacterium]
MNIPLNIDWQQILLSLFNFAILAVGLYLLLYNPVKKFMEERKAHYQALEEKASETKKLIESLKQEYEKRIAEAEDELRAKRLAVEKETREQAERELIEAREQAAAVLVRAQGAAREEKTRLLEEARRELADIVVGATQKLIAASSSAETDSALYDKFLAVAGKGEPQP